MFQFNFLLKELLIKWWFPDNYKSYKMRVNYDKRSKC